MVLQVVPLEGRAPTSGGLTFAPVHPPGAIVARAEPAQRGIEEAKKPQLQNPVKWKSISTLVASHFIDTLEDYFYNLGRSRAQIVSQTEDGLRSVGEPPNKHLYGIQFIEKVATFDGGVTNLTFVDLLLIGPNEKEAVSYPIRVTIIGEADSPRPNIQIKVFPANTPLSEVEVPFI